MKNKMCLTKYCTKKRWNDNFWDF